METIINMFEALPEIILIIKWSVGLSQFFLKPNYSVNFSVIYEPHREKTGFLHMRKQRRRSASR